MIWFTMKRPSAMVVLTQSRSHVLTIPDQALQQQTTALRFENPHQNQPMRFMSCHQTEQAAGILSLTKQSTGCVSVCRRWTVLKRPAAIQEVNNVAFVRLEPVELKRLDFPDV